MTLTEHDTGSIARVAGVTKRYGEDVVLRDVSLEVALGETVVVVGPSGAGKSTLLRCIAGLEPVDGGRIEFAERQILADKQTRYAIGGDIGMVFQSFNLFPHLTALENVALAPRRVRGRSRAEAQDEGRRQLDSVGLAHKADAYPDDLSGGQQQRVAIARALAMQPKLMLFDEPTAALDPELTREVLDTMLELARSGMTLIVVTHELAFARRAATRLVFMEAGAKVEEGPPEQLFDAASHGRTREYLRDRADG